MRSRLDLAAYGELLEEGGELPVGTVQPPLEPLGAIRLWRSKLPESRPGGAHDDLWRSACWEASALEHQDERIMVRAARYLRSYVLGRRRGRHG